MIYYASFAVGIAGLGTEDKLRFGLFSHGRVKCKGYQVISLWAIRGECTCIFGSLVCPIGNETPTLFTRGGHMGGGLSVLLAVMSPYALV